MTARQFMLDLNGKLIVDLFAGGGGMSLAFERAFGRSPDIAVNHDDDALSMHRMNHPQTRHFVADVFEVCPRSVTQGRPVGWLHGSPDCTHHSQAAGGQPRSKKIRGLGWVLPRWASRILLEVTAVRVERLQYISLVDCIAEGAPGGHGVIPGYTYSATPDEHYRHIWQTINGPDSWKENPWVWVIEFKRVTP